MRPSAWVDKLLGTLPGMALQLRASEKERVDREGPVRGSDEGRFASTSGTGAQVWLGFARTVPAALIALIGTRFGSQWPDPMTAHGRLNENEDKRSSALSGWIHPLGPLPHGGGRRLAGWAGPLPGHQEPLSHVPGTLNRGPTSQQTRVHTLRHRCRSDPSWPAARSHVRRIP